MAIIMEPSQGQEGGTIFLVFIRPHDKTSRLQPACTMIEYIYDILLGINVCFSHISFFFSLPAAGRFSCSRLRGAQGARPDTKAQFWALTEVCGTCSRGSKLQVTTRRHSMNIRKPPRPMKTHVPVFKNVRRLM